MKTVKVTTDNKVSVIDVNFDDFRSIPQAIGGHFETVRTQLMADYFKDPHCTERRSMAVLLLET